VRRTGFSLTKRSVVTIGVIRAMSALVLCVGSAVGATRAEAQPLRVRKLSFTPVQLDSAPPFDESFVIKVPVPAGVTTVHLAYGPTQRVATRQGRTKRYQRTPITLDTLTGTVDPRDPEFVAFEVGPLEPYDTYGFYFDFVAPSSVTRSTIFTRSDASYKNRFDTDFGVAFSPHPGPRYFGATSNVHFYTVPINPRERPDQYHRWDHLTKRVSAYGGLTLARFSTKDEVVDFFPTGNLALGLGLRLQLPWERAQFINFFRFHGGVLFFKQDDPNPTVSHNDIKRSPVIGLGADFELKDFFGPLTGILGIK
jgi:hypothetical protein